MTSKADSPAKADCQKLLRKFNVMFNAGKKRKLPYYISCYWALLKPSVIYRWRLRSNLAKIESRPDSLYINSRIDYYNRLPEHSQLESGTQLRHFTRGHFKRDYKVGTVYFFDGFRFLRWFDRSLRWRYYPGDISFIPSTPGIVKSRPIERVPGDNVNSVLMKLNALRHFIFVNDNRQFAQKKDMAVFRGKINGKGNRYEFMSKFSDDERFDCGVTDKRGDCPASWFRGKLTIDDQLEYKYILSLEGVDVASNLKWIMSSNSLAVMPRPNFETWFMEGTLKPGVHYIEIKEDFSDLKEKMDYYTEHPLEAQKIIENAHRYVAQFLDEEREQLIQLGVMDKYFRMTDQRI